MCSGADVAVVQRNENVARLLERRLAPVDVQPRTNDCRRSRPRARVAWLAPMALMCVPGASHSPNSTGSRADVVVQTIVGVADGVGGAVGDRRVESESFARHSRE